MFLFQLTSRAGGTSSLSGGVIRNWPVQWAAGLGLLAMMLAFTIIFSSKLKSHLNLFISGYEL